MEYNTKAVDRARNLRTKQTSAEAKLWSILRNNGFNGLKFRRQCPYKNFILDFFCFKEKICLEVDGDSHGFDGNIEKDKERDKVLEKDGIRVIRVDNFSVLKKPKETINYLYHKIFENQ